MPDPVTLTLWGTGYFFVVLCSRMKLNYLETAYFFQVLLCVVLSNSLPRPDPLCTSFALVWLESGTNPSPTEPQVLLPLILS